MDWADKDIRQLQGATFKLINSQSLREAGEVILSNAEVLLHPGADAFYDLLRARHPGSMVLIETRLDLLDRCRATDPEKAIVDYERLFVLWDLIVLARLDPASERERAGELVRLCDEALEHVRLRRVNRPRVCGWLLMVLAEALLQNPQGSRVDNVELALLHLRTCVDWVLPLSDFQQAEVHRLLGDAYQLRTLGEINENLSSARDAYERALTFLVQHSPGMRARVEARLISCCPPTNSQEVVWEWLTRHTREALSVFTADAHPLEHALTKLRCLGELLDNVDAASQDVAFQQYEDAIRLLPENAAIEAAEAWVKLAGSRRRSACSRADWESCCQGAEIALRLLAERDIPRLRREALELLGTALYHLEEPKSALLAFDEAASVSEALLESAYTASSVRIEAATTGDIHLGAAWCFVRLGLYEQALLRHERGRARALEEYLSAHEVSLAPISEPDREAFARAHLEWSVSVKHAGYSSLDRNPDPDVLLQCRVARAAFVEQRRRLQLSDWLAPRTFEDVRSLVPRGGAIVSFLVSEHGSSALVVRDGAEAINEEHVVTLWRPGSLRQEQSDLRAVGIAWMGSYAEDWWIKQDRDLWMESIVEQTGHLWESVMGPVFERLRRLGVPEHAPVVLMLCGSLHNLPLHAAWRAVDGRRRPFLMDHTVLYAPSLTLLTVSRRRAKDPTRVGRSLVLVRDPTNDLSHALAEGEAIKLRFPEPKRTVHGAGLNLPALWSDLRQGTYIHLACHATFGTEPDLAALNLGTMTPVTVSDIRDFWYLERARLVTLSACETGIGSFAQLANETTGMVEALFGVGSSTLIASLWAVDDLSTFLIMDELYRRILDDGLEPPAALCAAQRWLLNVSPDELDARLAEAQSRLREEDREVCAPLEGQLEKARSSLRHLGPKSKRGREELRHDPYAHPFYWAAFRCIGV
jgi:CHAT domain-containing protein/tetratricopeptide (TPR) repeat protein